jgi:hypothetical protein
VSQPPRPQNPASSLGRLIKVYALRHAFWRTWGSLILGITGLTGFLIVAVTGSYFTYLRYYNNGPAAVPRLGFPVLAAALVLLALGILGASVAGRYWGRSISLYDQGLAVSSRKGRQIWRWTDIGGLRTQVTRRYLGWVPAGSAHSYTLSGGRNQHVVLDDTYAHIEELGDVVRSRVYPQHYQEAARHLQAGHPVCFGPVQLDPQQGLALRGKKLAWEQVAAVKTGPGWVEIRPVKAIPGLPRLRFPAAAIDDLDVLLALLKERVPFV